MQTDTQSHRLGEREKNTHNKNKLRHANTNSLDTQKHKDGKINTQTDTQSGTMGEREKQIIQSQTHTKTIHRDTQTEAESHDHGERETRKHTHK